MKSLQLIRTLAICILSFLSFSPIFACTGLQVKAVDGSFVSGRTIEFGLDLNLAGLVVPRNYAFQGTLPDGSVGMQYRSKYAAVGGNMFGEDAIADGLNEKGLSIGSFYFPEYATYATVSADNKSHALSPTQFPNWILTQFATVDEVKQALKSAVIVGTTPKGWPVLPPFHYIVYDKSGKSIVIEPIDGQLKVYDNPLGVFTNSPTFDWHLTNLSNYINLSTINVSPVVVDGLKLQEFGSGSGLRGLPGDFTPPSRFVRAAVFASSAIPVANSAEAVLQVFHLLNQFDIPVGAVRQVQGAQMISESTLATVVRDPNTLKFYFKTYINQNIQGVDLNAFDLNAKDIKRFSMNEPQSIKEISVPGAEPKKAV